MTIIINFRLLLKKILVLLQMSSPVRSPLTNSMNWDIVVKQTRIGKSLVVQSLGLCPSTTEAWVQSLVKNEDPISCRAK